MAQEAKLAPKVKNRTLAVSDDFADMIKALADSRGLTVRAYCDTVAAAKFAPDYRSVLKDRLKKAGG